MVQNHFDQADGTAISVANSGPYNSDAFQSVGSNGLTLVYATAQKMHGFASMKVNTPGSGSSSGQVVYRNPGAAATSFAFRFYLYLAGLPSSNMNVLYAVTSDGQNPSIVNVNSSGTLGYSGLPGSSQAIPAGTFTFATGKWYRIEGVLTLGTGTSGSYLLQVFSGDSTTPLATLNPTGIATCTTAGATLTQLQLGKNTGSPVISPYFLDDWAVGYGATQPLGPYVPEAPSVIASSSISGTAATLTAIPYTYDNVAPTFAWTQTAGPAVTLSSTTSASPTFTVATGGTYGFQVTVTDDLGKTATATTTVQYSGAANGPTVSGVLQPGTNWVAQITAAPAAGGALSYAVTPSGVTVLPVSGGAVLVGPTPSVATAYTVTVTESGNSNTTTYRITVPGTPTTLGGVRILLASADQTAGGTFS